VASTSDTLILGGGVIGLSLAYELAGQGRRVHVIDRAQPAREASWAAAGIIPACKFRMRAAPLEWLSGFSAHLHAEWAARLREETGIDNGFRRSGGIYLADTEANSVELLHTCERWRREGLTVKWLHGADLDQLEPALAGIYDRCHMHGAALVAEEIQIRSPRHLRALLVACRKRGVQISPGIEAFDFEIREGRVDSVLTNVGALSADQVVLAAGAWSQPIAARLGLKMHVKPMRGQVLLLDAQRILIQRIVNLGRNYLLPRDDGRILVGTTLEDVGFDRRNTAEAISDLLRFAADLAPELKSANLERAWAGFRPASVDELPYLGRVPDLKNAFVATGHFRSGLWWSTGTAVVMSRLLRGESPGVDLSPFRVDRGNP
jgi:glycine oxidase